MPRAPEAGRMGIRELMQGASGVGAVAFVVCEDCRTTYERPFHQCPARFPAGVPEVSPATVTMSAAGHAATNADRASWERLEAEWFRWLRDNPQAAAYITVLVAKLRPAGPDLGASMNSGEVVGVMEDAKQPEYRFRTDVPLGFEITDALMSAVEQAVRSCAEQAEKGMPAGTWSVDYAGILSRVIAALRSAR